MALSGSINKTFKFSISFKFCGFGKKKCGFSLHETSVNGKTKR
jgi:hypothetical protein